MRFDTNEKVASPSAFWPEGTSFSLPYFLYPWNKATVGFGSAIFAAVFYMLTNHFPLFESSLLPFTTIDRITPFIPSTVWIYLSEYFLILSAFFVDSDLRKANRFVYGFLFLQFISNAIFLAFPTHYPRQWFPIPIGTDPASEFILNIIRNADTASNCAPSLHVSCCYFASFVFLEVKGPKRFLFPVYFLWATLVGISTLTTKQHYLVDVVLGFIFGILAYWFFVQKVNYYLPIPKDLGTVRVRGKTLRFPSV